MIEKPSRAMRSAWASMVSVSSTEPRVPVTDPGGDCVARARARRGSGGLATPDLVHAVEADHDRRVGAETLERARELVHLVDVGETRRLEFGSQMRHRERGELLALAATEGRLHHIEVHTLEAAGVEQRREARAEIGVTATAAQGGIGELHVAGEL